MTTPTQLYFSQIIPKVSYTVDVDNSGVRSWEAHPLRTDRLETAVADDFGTDLELWTNLTNALRQLYLEGDAKSNYGKKGQVKSAVVTAYSKANNGKHFFLSLNNGPLLCIFLHVCL